MWCQVSNAFEAKEAGSRAERCDEGRDNFSRHRGAEKDRYGLDRQIWF
jgi:hypothetical protein